MTLYYLRYGLSLLDYTVTVIQDEDVALAPGPQKNYFGGAGLSMTLLVLAAIVVCYILRCQAMRKRIAELNTHLFDHPERQITPGWNIWKMKEQIRLLEGEAVKVWQ